MLRGKLDNGAGKRNTRVTIEKASDKAANSSYEVTPTWTTLCERWAEMAITSGREFQAALQVVPQLMGIVKLPYDTRTKTITSRDRITIGDRTLNIAGIWNENETNEKIVVWCVETN